MPRWNERTRLQALIALMTGAGFALTLIVFYPGIMTYDAKYVYLAIKGGAGDWQSPVMTWLWSVIDPIAPGSGSMFLLIAGTYWLAFGVLALAMARRSAWLALALPVLALTPPAFMMIGVIWRDMLLAGTWLLAASLVFATAECNRPIRVPAQLIALLLIAFGVLLRPNALLAAPLLAAYAIWPARFSLTRSALIYLPAALAFYSLVPLVYYTALGAKREHPLHSIFVFDLGGISHFARENQFPSTWSPSETKLLLDGCYKPTLWDIYWTQDPCKFVMAKLEGEKIFGTPAMTDAWRRAVTRHPLAYLQHRGAFMWTFLAGANLTMWTHDIEGFDTSVFANRPAFNTLRSLHDVLKETLLFRAGVWLLACVGIAAFAWRKRATPQGAFALAACGSAILYVLTLFFVGVAPDFRYAYWAVLAALASIPVVAARPAALAQREAVP